MLIPGLGEAGGAARIALRRVSGVVYTSVSNPDIPTAVIETSDVPKNNGTAELVDFGLSASIRTP